MSKFVWLIDPGHGGEIDGVYQTSPNFDKNDPSTWHKSYYHKDEDLVIWEGVFNRAVARKLIRLLVAEDIECKLIAHGEEDIPLYKRVQYADELQALHGRCVYVSIHGNAGGGHGHEIYTSVGQTKSDKIAEVFIKHMEKEFPEQTSRKDLTDGDSDKEAQFYVLRKTDCPAILTENFFMDDPEDAKLMISEEGQSRVAKAHFNAILDIEENGV